MSNKMMIAFVCFCLAPAANAQVNFDQGVDIQAAIEGAATLDYIHPHPGAYPSRRRYTRDCTRFTFSGSGPVSSERVYLNSTEYVEYCEYIPDDPPPHHPHHPPHHHGGPHHGPRAVESVDKGMHCYERPGETWRRTAQLNIGSRQLLPWESEKIEVCLEGPNMTMRIREAAYNYTYTSFGNYDVTYELVPQYKIPMSPDENGLSLAEFSFADGKYTMKVNDLWAAEYAGEKVAITVELHKDGFLFFNANKGEKEFMFDAAPGYEMVFAENELTKSRSASKFSDGSDLPETAGIPDERCFKKYFVKWGFKRVGQLSTGEFVKKGKTASIEPR